MKKQPLFLAALAISFGAFSDAGATTNMETYQSVLSSVRMDNKYKNYAKADYTPMEKGEAGNCARFAGTYKKRLAELGHESYIGVCVLKEGIAHAFTMTKDGWVLDNRFKYLVRWEDVGCKTY